jgi:hypothetical protein
MQTRYKKLMKLAAEGDVIAFQAEVERVLEALEADKAPHLNALAQIEKDMESVNGIVRLTLPKSITSQSKPSAERQPKEPSADGYTKKQRGQFIRDTAMSLVNQGKTEISIKDVVSELSRKGIEFGIKRPEAAIGSTLTQMKEFQRTEAGNYRYIGTEMQSDALPYMESAEAH